ncbi:MAG TPA: anthranilate synthase component II, partial [Corynebacterium glutamicum]|nr:anthranilate synthase component II [Corynebacterium glutamicum]
DVIMAARTTDGKAIGLQFHPESVLSPTGPVILSRCVEQLLAN